MNSSLMQPVLVRGRCRSYNRGAVLALLKSFAARQFENQVMDRAAIVIESSSPVTFASCPPLPREERVQNSKITAPSVADRGSAAHRSAGRTPAWAAGGLDSKGDSPDKA